MNELILFQKLNLEKSEISRFKAVFEKRARQEKIAEQEYQSIRSYLLTLQERLEANQEHQCLVEYNIRAIVTNFSSVSDRYFKMRDLKSTIERLDKAQAFIQMDLDRLAWKECFSIFNLMDYLPISQKEEFRKYFDTDFFLGVDEKGSYLEAIKAKHIPFTPENVFSTVGHLLKNRKANLAQRVADVFQRLSWEHKTNSKRMFNGKLIFKAGNYSKWGSFSFWGDMVQEFRIVVDIIANNGKLYTGENETQSYKENYKLEQMIPRHFGEWIKLDDERIKAKFFKNGNAHIEVSNEVCDRLNDFLSYHYSHHIA